MATEVHEAVNHYRCRSCGNRIDLKLLTRIGSFGMAMIEYVPLYRSEGVHLGLAIKDSDDAYIPIECAACDTELGFRWILGVDPDIEEHDITQYHGLEEDDMCFLLLNSLVRRTGSSAYYADTGELAYTVEAGEASSDKSSGPSFLMEYYAGGKAASLNVHEDDRKIGDGCFICRSCHGPVARINNSCGSDGHWGYFSAIENTRESDTGKLKCGFCSKSIGFSMGRENHLLMSEMLLVFDDSLIHPLTGVCMRASIQTED